LLKEFLTLLRPRAWLSALFFSKIDFVKAYHQIHITKADMPKRVIATPVGLFQFPFMVFGLKKAAQTLQCLTDNILVGLDYVFSFLDDDNVYIKTKEQHRQHPASLPHPVWMGLSKHVTTWMRACLHCQWAQIHHHIQVPPQDIPVPTQRFSYIQVDLVGPPQHHKDSATCSLSWTELLADQRGYLSQPPQQ
jgi:hypothetical protein